MQLELDHIFVCVDPEAPEAQLLKDFGLTEGGRRIHRGQGTTNVCFFFHNAYLELLWLFDEDEIQSPTVRRMGLWERCRWKETQACPFGIAFRKAPNLLNLPFSTWDYQAPYRPPEAPIQTATNSQNVSEPLIFISPAKQKPADSNLGDRQVLVHKFGLNEITGVRVSLAGNQDFSREINDVNGLGTVTFLQEDFYHLEIEFDNAKSGNSHSFRDVLPLSIKW
jgi:Glyoxalase-like domain